jgi:beta-lactamase class A
LLWAKLQQEIERAMDAFPGVAGVAVASLTHAAGCAVQAGEIFPTASTIKIPILVQLLMRARAGEVELAQQMTVPAESHVLGSGVVAYLAGPVTLSLLDLAILMIIVSDNTATNLCLEVAGMDATNALLAQMGLQQTRLRRKMMDEMAAVRELENVATPAELVELLRLLYAGQPDAQVAAQALEILTKPKEGILNKALPPDLPVANKPGWVEGARCDAGIVYLPRRPYVVAIMSKYAQCSDREHEQALIALARLIHRWMSVLDRSNRYGRTVYAAA